MFTLPFICVVCNICPYGIDLWLWLTHFFRLASTFILTIHADTLGKRLAALNSQTSSRILYFINVKAVLNTIMVTLRWKLPGAFKETKKASTAPEPVAEARESTAAYPSVTPQSKPLVAPKGKRPMFTFVPRCSVRSKALLSCVASPCDCAEKGSAAFGLRDGSPVSTLGLACTACGQGGTVLQSSRRSQKGALPVAESFEPERTAVERVNTCSSAGSGQPASRKPSQAEPQDAAPTAQVWCPLPTCTLSWRECASSRGATPPV